jgi:hypothetical protein
MIGRGVSSLHKFSAWNGRDTGVAAKHLDEVLGTILRPQEPHVSCAQERLGQISPGININMVKITSVFQEFALE